MTLADLVCHYDEDIAPNLRKAEPKRCRFGEMLRDPISTLRLEDLTANAVASHRDDRLRVTKPATVKLELSLFGRIIGLARREWGALPGNLLVAPVVRSATETGMRRGELPALEWLHIDRAKRTAHLPIIKNG